MSFFKEWADDSWSLTLVRLLCILTVIGTIFLVVNGNISSSISIYLLASAIIVFIVAQTEKEIASEIVRANFFGSGKSVTYLGLGIGLAVGMFLGIQSTGLSLVMPSRPETLAISYDSMRFIFANLVAPIIEPLFWRGVVFFTVLAIAFKFFGKKNTAPAIIVALLVSGGAFGFFHVSTAFSQTGAFIPTYNYIITAAIFGIIFILTNQLMKTVALEIGWHFANNLFSEGFTLNEIIPTVVIFFIAFALLIEFASRVSKGKT